MDESESTGVIHEVFEIESSRTMNGVPGLG